MQYYPEIAITKRPNLSPRPLQVIQLLARGLTTKQTAMVMGISKDTVSTHIQRARAALGAGTRDELMAMVGAMGLVVPKNKKSFPRRKFPLLPTNKVLEG